MKNNIQLKKSIAIIFIVLLIDQISKIYIKTHFFLGETVHIFGLDWARLHFVENNGMAWGTEFGGRNGKLFLTLFRWVAITGIGYWLVSSIKQNASRLLTFAIALIFAGAFGNIIDSTFYGLIFDASDPDTQNIATLFSDNTYESIFHGKVVDMFYFPLIKNAELYSWIPSINFYWPSWMPFVGDKNFSLFVDRRFTFFNAIFNVADFAISVGVGILIVFNKRVFPKEEKATDSNA